MKQKWLNDPSISRRYNYLYKITNLINNKIYIGVHRTDNLDDGYMGSGKILKRSFAKYGVENFKKEILEYFSTYQEALDKEREIVTETFIEQEDVYNIKEGGFGNCGWSTTMLKEFSKIAQKRWENPEYQEKMKIALNSPKRTKAIGTKVKKWIQEHPEEHKERMDKINKNPEKIRKTAEKHKGMKRNKKGCKNISTGINKALKDPKVRAARSGKGQKYAHNILTKEVKRFDANVELLEGWVWGSLKQSGETRAKRSASLIGSYFAYNKKTKEIKRFKAGQLLPDGWIKGRP